MANEGNTKFKFISYDGTDGNGDRAEVAVQQGRGTIKKIDENISAGVADVHFSVPNLKLPVHGWIPINEPLYEIIKNAQNTGEELDYRIEVQRKPNVDRKKPMSELQADAQVAREYVRRLLVGINKALTSEAVTNPNEDPVSQTGRYVATDADMAKSSPSGAGTANVNLETQLENFRTASNNPNVRPEILDAMASTLILNGATVETINTILAGESKRDLTQPEARTYVSIEAPAYKEFNSDGARNLGSSTIAAGVGVETLIHDQLVTLADETVPGGIITNLDDAVVYYMDVVFAISDRIQEAVYGNGFKADRGAGSHTRVRGFVYEIIKKSHKLPVTFATTGDNTVEVRITETGHNEWVKAVGTEGVKRFKRATESATTNKGFRVTPPASLLGGATPTTPVTAPISTVPAPTPAPAPHPVPTPAVETPQETVEETVIENIEAETATEPLEDVAEAEPTVHAHEIYINHVTEANSKGEELATAGTVNEFKQLFEEYGYHLNKADELSRIAKLITFTFGPNVTKIQNVPDAMVLDFIDHYAAHGNEALDYAVRQAVGE